MIDPLIIHCISLSILAFTINRTGDFFNDLPLCHGGLTCRVFCELISFYGHHLMSRGNKNC